jgi:hypothetical protein
MAIVIRGKSACQLCGNVMAEGDALVMTSPFISDRSDPLWRFSDAAFHAPCFSGWEKKAEFVRQFNEAHKTWRRPDGTHLVMSEDGVITSVPFDTKKTPNQTTTANDLHTD